jgi:hypothetical protein
VYGWIWRALPGGTVGKLLGCTVLIVLVVLLLFFVVFPAVEPLLPFGDVTVGDGTSAAASWA